MFYCVFLLIQGNVMSWNKDAAVNYARNRAGSASQHRCAHFVSNAVRAGGARLINTNYA